MGDASAGKDTCAGWCFTYTEQLAASLQQDAQQPVRIEDRSWRSNTWPPASVNSVLAYLRADPGLRVAAHSADVLVLALTDRDVLSAAQADACGRKRQPRCIEKASHRLGEQLDTLLSEVSRIRQARPVVLHVILAPSPGTPGHAGAQVTRAGCRVARLHQGACVDLSQLRQRGLLAPADWALVAGHPWLSQHGHDVVARELITANGRGKGSTGAR